MGDLEECHFLALSHLGNSMWRAGSHARPPTNQRLLPPEPRAVLLPASLSLDTGTGGRVCSEQAFQNNTNLSSSFFSTGVSMMEYLGIGVMGTSGGKFFFRLAPSG